MQKPMLFRGRRLRRRLLVLPAVMGGIRRQNKAKSLQRVILPIEYDETEQKLKNVNKITENATAERPSNFQQPPACQPACQPASQPASRPTELPVSRAAGQLRTKR